MREIKRISSRRELLKLLPRNAVVAEIGVERGDYSQLILSLASPAKLLLIDPWEYQAESVFPETINPSRNTPEKQERNYRDVVRRFRSELKGGRLAIRRGYSATVLKRFPDNYFDWAYIDGNHQYEFVRQDLELCRLKVKEGGYICGHDYIEGNIVSKVKYGVIRAVNEFCERYGWRIICLADEFWEGGNYQSYVLAKEGLGAFLKRAAGRVARCAMRIHLKHYLQERGCARACVQGLWIGTRLSLMEQLSIRSFLVNGHPFHLYVYDDVRDVPAGTVIKDANEILPERDIFVCTNGSYAGFANLFRYKMLCEKGGYWVDLDAVCLRPFDFESDYVLSSEYTKNRDRKIHNGVLRVPRGSAFIRTCYERARAVDTSRVEFGDTGYVIFIPLVAEYGFEHFVYPPETFCPFDWWDCVKQIDPRCDLKIPEESYAIHLWNEIWRREGFDKDKRYDPGSLYGKLQRRFLESA